MPSLEFFAVCEKCILDQRNNVTLVDLMFGLMANRAQPNANAILPKNAVIPTTWAIYTRWKPEPGDVGKEFVQKATVSWPDGTEFVAVNPITFRLEQDKYHQIQAQILGFPIGQLGNVMIKVWAEWDKRQIGEAKTWTVKVLHQSPAN